MSAHNIPILSHTVAAEIEPILNKLSKKSIKIMEPETFVYTPLEQNSREIRLLSLIGRASGPFDPESQMDFELHHFSLEDAPPYFAISYAWGDPTLSYQITCNRRLKSITKSLAAALSSIYTAQQYGEDHKDGDDVYLWADGLCINQSDHREKEGQVKIMWDIYSKATAVLAYIGDCPSGDPRRDFMMLISRGAYLLSEYSPKPGTSEVSLPTIPMDLHVPFWSLPFFGRGWITQEIVLAKNILCYYGKGLDTFVFNASNIFQVLQSELKREEESLEEDDLEDRTFIPELHFHTWDTFGTHAKQVAMWDGLRRKRKAGMQAFDLLTLLQLNRHALITDPRDKIYCIRSLLNDDDRAAIRVDYSKLNAARQVFVDVAKYCIEINRGMQLLECAGSQPNSTIDTQYLPIRSIHVSEPEFIPDLPSWVPNFTFVPAMPLVSQLYKCGGSGQPNISLAPDEGKIIVRGTIVDEISHIGPRCHYPTDSLYVPPVLQTDFTEAMIGCRIITDPVESLATLERHVMYLCRRQLHLLGVKPHGEIPTEEDACGMALRVLTADRSWQPRRSTPLDRCHYDAFRREYYYQPEESDGSTDSKPNFLRTVLRQIPSLFRKLFRRIRSARTTKKREVEPVGKSNAFKLNVQRIQRGRAVGLSKNGLIGMFPNNTELGDVIAVFLGGNLPFILRPTPNNEFQLIGPCYVDKMMDGEVLELMERTDEFAEPLVAPFQDLVIV